MTENNRSKLHQRIISVFIALVLLVEMIPGTVAFAADGQADWKKPDVQALVSEAKAEAEQEVADALEKAGVEKLPTLEEYYASVGGAPKVVSLKAFMEQVGVYSAFDSAKAADYNDYQIRIDTAEDLYQWSLNCNSAIAAEKNYYLSAHFILGNNIEYQKGNYADAEGVTYYYRPVGETAAPFRGTFDGQGFEIRELAFDTATRPADPYGYGLFGVVGTDGVIQNLGLYGVADMTVNGHTPLAVRLGMISVINQGLIQNVYCDLTDLNGTFEAANCGFGGIVYENQGTIKSVYYAGLDETATEDSTYLHDPICSENSGTIEAAYYDATVFTQTITGASAAEDTAVAGMTTIELKTLGQNDLNDEVEFFNDTAEKYHWHILRKVVNGSALSTLLSSVNQVNTYFQYPKLYGFTSDLQQYYYGQNHGTEFSISTPADLVYFSVAPEYGIIYSYNYHFVFQMTCDIDMSYVADDAFVPSSADFRSFFTAETENAAAFNNSYSIINLRITQPGIYVDGNGFKFYYYGLIGRSSGASGILDSAVSGQSHGCISNVNFVGGGVYTGGYDFSQSYLAGNVQLYIGMAGGYVNSGSVVNVHSSADVMFNDGTVALRTYMGGLFGLLSCERAENLTNSGTVYGGTHPYTEGYHGNDSSVGGIAGFMSSNGNITNLERYHLKNIVNYGKVIGIGIYGSLSTDPERMQADHTNNNAATYINRARYYYVGGVCGKSNSNICLDMLVNFGNVLDVPSDEQEVPVYNEQNRQIGSEKRWAGRVPDEASYILNYDSRIAGVCGIGLDASNKSGAKLSVYYGYDLDSSKQTADTGFYDRIYNFGAVTTAESRYGYVGGIRAYGQYLTANWVNFGDIVSYSLQYRCSGIGAITTGTDHVVYDSANYGNIYMDNSSRSGGQTHFTSSSSPYICGIGWADTTRCENYGKITLSYAGYVPWSRNATSKTQIYYADSGVLGIGYLADSCTNYGNIDVTTFDRWTGEYVYVDLTADHFLKAANGETLYESYFYAAYSQSNRRMYTSGVAFHTATQCVNYGDITLSGTPDGYDKLQHTYAELTEALGYSPNAERRSQEGASANGWDNKVIYGTGLSSDRVLLDYQRLFRDCYVNGIASVVDGVATVRNCVNFGTIKADYFGISTNAAGIAYSGRITNAVNRGDLTVSNNSNGSINITGISIVSPQIENSLNAGALTALSADCNVYLSGILYALSSSEWSVINSINLGNLTVRRGSGQRTRFGAQTTYAAGIISSLSSAYNGSIYGCGNYGDIEIQSDTKRYISDDLDTTCDTTRLEYGQIAPSAVYDRNGDVIRVGGIFGSMDYQGGTGAHTLSVNSCINQGNIMFDCKQMYAQSVAYIGGIGGAVTTGDNVRYGGTAVVLSNAVNHGSIYAEFQQEAYNINNASYSLVLSGVVGYIYGGYAANSTPAVRSVFENLVNTGDLNGTAKKADGSDSRYPARIGGFAGRLYYGQTNSKGNLTIRKVLNYSDTPLFDLLEQLTTWCMLSDESGNGITLSNGNTTFGNRLTLEELYSANSEQETVTIGAANWKDQDGNIIPQKHYTVGVMTTQAEQNGESVSDDAADTRVYRYIYPIFAEDGTQTADAFFKRGETNSDTGVVCAIGYLDYGGLSTAYRGKYRKLNGGHYDTSEPEKPEDENSAEYESYMEWFKQLGGFVLTSAKPGADGADYLPNQFVPSMVKPGSTVDIWYTDYLKKKLGNDCAQVDLLDLNDLLNLYLTDGSQTTLSSRREKTETDNTLYVYVPNSMAENVLKVQSYQISSGAEVVFYRDPEHTKEISDIYADSIKLEAGTPDENGVTRYFYTLYARVTAQNGETADWVIRFQSVSGDPGISVKSALITNSARGDNMSTRTYYPSISEEALQSKNFWDYPAFAYSPLMNLTLETKNIENETKLYDCLKTYYYVQNAYGITEKGAAAGITKDSCLADLLAEASGHYTMAGNGDILLNGEIVAELLYKGAGYELIPSEENTFSVKAEKYSCEKPENGADDYYLTSANANILWEFVQSDGMSLISRKNPDFFSEETGAYKREYPNTVSFGWSSANRVTTAEDANTDGDLTGTYTLYTGGLQEPVPGGYYELVFELSDEVKDSVYIAVNRSEQTRMNTLWQTFSMTPLGSTVEKNMAEQWNVSESVREQWHDGYGAHRTYAEAAQAIQSALDSGTEPPYTAKHHYSQYLLGNDPIFAQLSNTGYDLYAGCADNSLNISGSYKAGSDTVERILYKTISYYRGAMIRPMIYKVHRYPDGAVETMDIIVQVISEGMGLTRFYPVQLTFPDSTVEISTVQYRSANDPYYAAASETTADIDGERVTVYEVPKGNESNFTMLTQYDTTKMSNPFYECNFALKSSTPEKNPTHNFDSLFAVEFCPEDGNAFEVLGTAEWKQGVGYQLITDSDAPAQVTATMERYSNTGATMTLNGNATMGYYRITPIYARSEYFYLHEAAEEFIKTLEDSVAIPGLDAAYKIEEKISDRGYPIYKVIMYMAYESTIIHKRANDDSYLRNIFMSNQMGGTANLSSIDADMSWDAENVYALSEPHQNLGAHNSIDGKSNMIRFTDGSIFYNADPLTDANDTCIENVNAFKVYAYISTSRRVNGVQTPVTEAWLDMKRDYLPGHAKLYYLKDAELSEEGDIIENTGTWTEVEFDENREVIDSQKDFFCYQHFAGENDVKEAKMFKVVAENGNVSYYTINAVQNKRNKSITVRVGDFEREADVIVEQDRGSKECLQEIVDNYGTFGVSLQLMVDGEAATLQNGLYRETGLDGNNFFNLKFGAYDILLNVPEATGYEYEVYYYGSGGKVELERSPDNPNAYRLPLRFANLTGENNAIEICVSIKKQPRTKWGYIVHRILNKQPDA